VTHRPLTTPDDGSLPGVIATPRFDEVAALPSFITGVNRSSMTHASIVDDVGGFMALGLRHGVGKGCELGAFDEAEDEDGVDVFLYLGQDMLPSFLSCLFLCILLTTCSSIFSSTAALKSYRDNVPPQCSPFDVFILLNSVCHRVRGKYTKQD